jgi:hypothetical protein
MEEKLKIRQLGLRHLQKQKRQAAMMTLKHQVLGVVFLPRAKALPRKARKLTGVSPPRGGRTLTHERSSLRQRGKRRVTGEN